MRKTIVGPGISIVLDSSQIIADDPGAGTPALVETDDGKYTATYWCAVDTGELDCGGYELNMSQQNWLEDKGDEVDAFMTAHS